MNRLHLRNIIRVSRLTILLPVSIMLILSAYLSSIDAQHELDDTLNHADSSDILAYVSDAGHLMLYNPRARTETLLLKDISGFIMGQDGQIAFTRQNDNKLDLYVFDPSTPDLTPISVNNDPGIYVYPLAWSQDGHYLAFGAYQDRNDQSIYIWNGETTINIMPETPLSTATGFQVDWSDDRRLAFQIGHYNWANGGLPPEIYLWDGTTTANLSQNTEGWDGVPRWSGTGQLMFGSSRGEDSNIYVWDGMSYSDSLPDIDSFVVVAPEFQPTNPIWTDEDSIIAFTLPRDASSSGEKEIIWWDTEAEAILRRYTIVSDNAYSWLAEGGQVVLSSHLASGIPSVYLDIENTEGEILFSEHVGEYAWSSDGYLAYCGITEKGQSLQLSIWDGDESWVVAEVSYRPARWQNGRNFFSCNNG